MSVGDRATQQALKTPLVPERSARDYNALIDVTAGVRSRILSSLKGLVKDASLADPEMWPCVRTVVGAAVDHAWSDVEHEVERSLAGPSAERELRCERALAGTPGPTRGARWGLYLSVRAFVLFHYVPYNLSIFGKFKDPVYVAIYLATLFPVSGMRVSIFFVILCMLFVPGPPDEFQLISYILRFKGMQFLTSGLMYLVSGSLQYFTCYSWHKDDVLQCIETQGPGTGNFWKMLMDYVGNLVLVWVAFAALPYSKNHAREPGAYDSPQNCQEDDVDEKCCSLFSGWKVRGGRLRSLMKYDLICFLISMCVLWLLSMCTLDFKNVSLAEAAVMRQMKENVFWSVVLYSLLSLPFFVFQIPVLLAVLTHSDPTGFNRQGACVPFHLPVAEGQDQEVANEARNTALDLSKDVLTHSAAAASTFLRIAEIGRAARGRAAEDEYARGDFTRGLWVKLTSAPPAQPPAPAALAPVQPGASVASPSALQADQRSSDAVASVSAAGVSFADSIWLHVLERWRGRPPGGCGAPPPGCPRDTA